MVRTYATLSREESGKHYQELQKQVAARQQRAPEAKSLGLLPETTRHIYATKILVINERPVLNIYFKKAGSGFLIFAAGFIILIAGAIFAKKLKRTMSTVRKKDRGA
jgi:hypothetical protein